MPILEVPGASIRCRVNGTLVLRAKEAALLGGDVGFVIGINLGATIVPIRVVNRWAGGALAN